MTRRESRATDRDGGPEWMLRQIESIAAPWTFERCGIGFGGPVDFPAQRVWVVGDTPHDIACARSIGARALTGEDYRGVFRIGRDFSDDVLPPYTELVRFDAGPRLRDGELRDAARGLLRHHLEHRPATNPFARFGAQLERDLPRLLDGEAADYHAYAFATVRMAGSAFEVAASHVDWLLGDAGAPACRALTKIVEGCKALSFRLARRRAFEPEQTVAGLAAAWDEAQDRLDDLLA